MKNVQREDIACFGNSYTGVMSVLETFSVPTVGLDEGGSEITALGGRPVALGFCECGSFKQGDSVRIIGKDCKKEAVILKLVPCTGAYPFEEELIAGVHKTDCTENTNAWLVLGLESEDVNGQHKIVKR